MGVEDELRLKDVSVSASCPLQRILIVRRGELRWLEGTTCKRFWYEV